MFDFEFHIGYNNYLRNLLIFIRSYLNKFLSVSNLNSLKIDKKRDASFSLTPLHFKNGIDLLMNYRFLVRTLKMGPALCPSCGSILTLIFPADTVSLCDSSYFFCHVGIVSFEGTDAYGFSSINLSNSESNSSDKLVP
jgi:hypothetical protein